MRILMVCRGNLCRSPLAERLLQHRLTVLGLGDRIDLGSAGTAAGAGAPMDAQAAAQLERLGGDPRGFQSRRVSATILSEADLVLTMSDRLRAETLQVLPRALRRTFTLGEVAGAVSSPDFSAAPGSAAFREEVARLRGHAGGRGDVPDPIGRSAGVHRQTADRIADDLSLLVPALVNQLG